MLYYIWHTVSEAIIMSPNNSSFLNTRQQEQSIAICIEWIEANISSYLKLEHSNTIISYHLNKRLQKMNDDNHKD